MKRAILSVAVAVSLAAVAGAEEKPKQEHPAKGQPQQTAPAKAEHPAKAAEHPPKQAAKEHPKKGMSNKDMKKQYSSAVEGYVKDESAKTGGAFAVKDDVQGKEWKLKLDRIHKNKIVSLGGDRYFACADFKSTEKDKTKVDLDFFAKRAPDGTFMVEKVQVHKVAGKARYVYNDKNEQVPVK